jgi:hypothetical protein
MQKLSGAQVEVMLKTSAACLRALSEENQQFREKLAQYQKKERAEALARSMEEKGLNDHLDFPEKVASLMERDDLDLLEKAVDLQAPQMKLASVSEYGSEGEDESFRNTDAPSDSATTRLLASLADE